MELKSDTTNYPLLDTIQRMACMGEYHKKDAAQHIERIRGHCFILGRSYGLSASDSEIISYASQLHDIGQVSLPPEIFARAGELTAFEWKLLKRHPIMGAEMLNNSPSLLIQTAETIALTHHERWDGSGYPRGLKGNIIPLSGLLCGLADIFDALTTPRPYKAEISVEEAYEMLVESGPQLFGPDLTRIFTISYNDMLKVRQSNL